MGDIYQYTFFLHMSPSFENRKKYIFISLPRTLSWQMSSDFENWKIKFLKHCLTFSWHMSPEFDILKFIFLLNAYFFNICRQVLKIEEFNFYLTHSLPSLAYVARFWNMLIYWSSQCLTTFYWHISPGFESWKKLNFYLTALLRSLDMCRRILKFVNLFFLLLPYYLLVRCLSTFRIL